MKGKTKAEQVAAFLKKAGKRRYTAEQVAEQCGCCAGYVAMFDCWKEYQKQFIKPTADERVHEYLSTVGNTIPPLKEVAIACKCDISTVVRTPSWKTHVKKYKSLPIKKRVETFLFAIWDKPKTYTVQQVAKQGKCSIHYVRSLDIWKKYRKYRKAQLAEERIRRFLSKDKTGRMRYTRRAVEIALKLGKNTIITSPAWQEYANKIRQATGQKVVKYQIWKRTPSAESEKRIKQFLSQDKTGERNFTVRDVVEAVGCSSATVKRSESWKKYREKVMALRPEGTVEERIVKAFPELLAEGIPSPTLGQVAARAKCCTNKVYRSPIWKRHRQLLQAAPAGSPPVQSATSTPIILGRIKKKKESADKTTFIESLGDTPIVNAPDEMLIVNEEPIPVAMKVIDPAVRKANREDMEAVLEKHTAALEAKKQKSEGMVDQKQKVRTPKKTHKERVHEAVRLVVNESMTQEQAEKQAGLKPRSLSRGYGKKCMEACRRDGGKYTTTGKDEADDFIYNESR